MSFLSKVENKLSIEERTDKNLNEYEDKREAIEKEIIQTVEDIKLLVGSLLDGIVKEMSPRIKETEAILDAEIRNFKRLVSRKEELLAKKKKLAPVLEYLSGSNSTAAA